MDDLFPGFERRRIATPIGEFPVLVKGSGPPVLMLHGFPQTKAIWNRVAPRIAERRRVVLMDLRGYGEAPVPQAADNNTTYSKREMAKDAVAVMAGLGHETFALVGHDRGARVGYRLALDEPERLTRLAVLDILPTGEVWRRMTAESALHAYHWMFLAQPKPLPETLLGGNPDYYVRQKVGSWTKSKSLAPFEPRALETHVAQAREPDRLAAMCADYRAGATVDRAYDDADRKTGRKITCPTLALWGTHYVGRGTVDPLAIWREWCADVTGTAIDSGHFLAEENPEATLEHLLKFLNEP